MSETTDSASERPALEQARRPWPKPPAAPRWMSWTPMAAVTWPLAYGALRVWWAVHGAPSFGRLGIDVLFFSGWNAAGLCAASALVALVLRVSPWSGPLLAAAAAVCVASLAACAKLLLDVVGGLFPYSGVPLNLPAFLSRAACLVQGLLLGAAVVTYRRRWRSDCLFCGQRGIPRRMTRPPWWAWCAAYAAVVGWLVRIVAQVAIGWFADSRQQPAAALLAFEACFVLAGTVLPLALVHSWGRVFPSWVPRRAGRRVPRWLPLGPALAIGGALTLYFGASILKFAAATVNGTWRQNGGSLPLAFFWVAMPAYLLWGVGLSVAALAYGALTRPKCRICDR